MINEGQFETAAKTTVNNTKIEKELKSLGLGYNGGDPIYTNNKKNATIASWELIPNKKAMNLLRANGEFSYPLSYGNNYYLEYNIRTKKFTIVRQLWTPGKDTKWFNPVEVKNPEILNSPIFKRAEEIAVQMKRNTQVVFTGGNKAYRSASNYGKEHLVKEDYREITDKKIWRDPKQVMRLRSALRKELNDNAWDVYLIRENNGRLEVYLKSPKIWTQKGRLYDVYYSSYDDKVNDKGMYKYSLSEDQKKKIKDIIKNEFGAMKIAIREEVDYFPY